MSIPSCLKPYLLIVYGTLSAFCYAISGVIVKDMSYVSPGELSLIANFGSTAFVLPVVVYYAGHLGFEGRVPLTVFTAFLLTTGIWIRFYAYRWIPLGETAVISCATPLAVALFARLYLGEALGATQLCAAMVAIVGVLISVRIPELFATRRTFDWRYFAGVGSALAAMLFLGSGITLERKLKEVHFSIRVLLTAMLGILENTVTVAFLEGHTLPHCGADRYLIMLLGLALSLAECFFVLATQVGQVALVSLVKTSMDVVFAMVLQVTLFGEIPDAYNLCGASLVLVSIFAIGVRQWLSTLPEDSKPRKKMKMLLM